MQLENLNRNAKARVEIVRKKRAYGMAYGAIAGLTFAVSTWGWDAVLLNQSHAFYPWLKLFIGAILCAMAGAFVGWLSARIEKALFTVIFWVGLSVVFSLLTVALPLRIAPAVAAWLKPQLGAFLHYGVYQEFMTRIQLAFFWNVIFTLIAGILQAPLVEPAAFSTSALGKAIPFLVCIVVLSIAGPLADNLNNEPLRKAIIALDQTIQFAVDHKGQEVDAATSRTHHQASLRTINDFISMSRKLIVSDYDESFGQINLLVKFENGWAKCLVVYAQVSNCNPIAVGTP